jgi:glucose repression regulatory protein TUP1
MMEQWEEEVNQRAEIPPPSSPAANPNAGLPPQSQPSSSHASSSPAPLVPFPGDLDPYSVPAELKKEGSDWFVLFNPKVKRELDVSLIHTLMHERYVPTAGRGYDGILFGLIRFGV